MQEKATIKGIHLGEDRIGEDEDLVLCSQLGVEYIHAFPLPAASARGMGPQGMPRGGTSVTERGYFDADALVIYREHVESFGLKIGSMYLPTRTTGIIFGLPERDCEIENICKSVKAVGEAGIPTLMWGFGGLGVVRSFGYSKGRGGVRYKYFDHGDVEDDPPHPYGPITAEQVWERIEYAVKRVIPVAEEYKVRMACHPMDVPTPPGKPYRGIVPVLNNAEGLKRFVNILDSPYHGLCFCQGCIAETSTNVEQVYEAIRYFGERKKIFLVHFRNIRGSLGKFEETFPDEGDIDMLKAMRIYKETGCDCVITPDHAPQLDLDARKYSTSGGYRARTFCIGYIRALIQAVESEN